VRYVETEQADTEPGDGDTGEFEQLASVDTVTEMTFAVRGCCTNTVVPNSPSRRPLKMPRSMKYAPSPTTPKASA
jgi:hypothetical protein